jgi:hypothetical protein
MSDSRRPRRLAKVKKVAFEVKIDLAVGHINLREWVRLYVGEILRIEGSGPAYSSSSSKPSPNEVADR